VSSNSVVSQVVRGRRTLMLPIRVGAKVCPQSSWWLWPLISPSCRGHNKSPISDADLQPSLRCYEIQILLNLDPLCVVFIFCVRFVVWLSLVFNQFSADLFSYLYTLDPRSSLRRGNSYGLENCMIHHVESRAWTHFAPMWTLFRRRSRGQKKFDRWGVVPWIRSTFVSTEST
jgi:hypothetical protein